MKKLKNFTALFLAVLMVFSTVMPTSAAGIDTGKNSVSETASMTNGGGSVANGIAEQPQDATAYEYEDAVFTVGATGNVRSYQWQVSKNNGRKWTNVRKATEETFTVNADPEFDGYLYRCQVTFSNKKVMKSDAAKLTVMQKAEEVTYPALESSQSAGDVNVSISAPEGALPEGTALEVSEVDASEVEDKVASVIGGEITDIYALDISFVNAEEEVEPAEGSEVEVVLTSDVFKTEETPNIVHIKDNGDAELVNAIINKEDGTATFKAESFSTFTVTWGNNSYKVTIHHGIMENGSFKEFGTSGLPSSSNTNYPTTLRWQDYYDDSYAVLIYDFKGYQYVETRYSANETSNPSSATAIWPALQKRNASGSSNDNWRYCNASRTSWNRDGAAANNSHVYVIYKLKPVTKGYIGDETDPDDPGDPDNPNAFKPDVGKNVTDMKDDGTYDITLSVLGEKDTSEVKTTARVIVVFDLSGSMAFNMAGGTSTSSTNPSRLTLAKNAVNKLADTLLKLEDSQHNKLVEMGLVTFATDARTRTFGTSASPFTSDYGVYSGVVSNLPISSQDTLGTGINEIGRGTNWEKGLDLANSMATSQTGKTYIVFVSDGDPTFRVSRGSYSDSSIISEISALNRVTLPIFGAGAEENFSGTEERCYTAAREVAKSIVDNDKTFYAVGLSNNATRMTNLATYAGGTYKAGNNADEFAASLAEIAGSISSEIGLTDVVITDGVTSMSHIETQALIGTAGNFVYNVAYPLTASSSGYTYKIGTQTHNVTQAQVDAGNAEGHRIFSRVTNGVTVYYIEYPWEGAPDATIQSDNSVKWDTSSASLEDGVLYSVTFTVWPKQEAYDHIADLSNELEKISDLEPGVKLQLRVLVNGTTYEYDTATNTWTGGLTDAQLQALIDANGAIYSMKTNTGLSASYKYGGATGSATYTNYTNGNMTLDTTTFSIHKNWVNQLPQDSRTAQVLTAQDEDGKYYLVDGDGEWILKNGEKILYDRSNPSSWEDDAVYYIDLIVTKGEDNYEEVRLLSSNNWTKDDIFISLGVLSVTNGNITVRETGHEYSVKEKPSDAYYWELTSYTYRPMVINGVTTMLQKIDEDDTNYEVASEIAENRTQTIGGTAYYNFEGGIYKAIAADSAVLEATNNRRSYLNLTKEVTGDGAPADALFTLTVKIDNPNGTHPSDASYDAGNDDYWFSAYDPVAGATVMNLQVQGATAEAGNTGFWHAQNGSTVTIKIKAGWNVRFTNLISGTTYQINEPKANLESGFVFSKVEASAKLGGDEQAYNPTIDDTMIDGSIESANTDYTVTYTNEYDVFYVYHSSNKIVELIPMAVKGVKMTTFDIYARTAEGTLYGGYYSDYAGKSSGFDATKLEYDENNKSEDTDGTAYNASKANVWKAANAYTVKGTEMKPVSGKVYYLKEVPIGYIRPYIHFIYDEVAPDQPLKQLYAISASDDTNYDYVGYILSPPKDTGTAFAKKSLIISLKTADGTLTKLTANSVFNEAQMAKYGLEKKDVLPRGYLWYTDFSSYIGQGFTYQPCWNTLDGILVKGLTIRSVTNGTTYPTIDVTDTPATE